MATIVCGILVAVALGFAVRHIYCNLISGKSDCCGSEHSCGGSCGGCGGCRQK